MKKILIVPLALAAVILFGLSLNHALLVNTCSVLVAMTDKSGKMVGLPQAYQSKVNTYYFYEMGPVYGTRTAILINAPHQDISCALVNLWSSKSGWFDGNSTYTFDLWASVKDTQSPDNSTVTE
jgi:hypothetical protein